MLKYTKWLKFISIFLLVYTISLATWLECKNIYNNTIASPIFSLVGWKYDFSVNEIHVNGSEVHTTLINSIPLRNKAGQKQDFEIDIIFDGSPITANVPMTLALLVSITLLVNGASIDKIKYILFGMSVLVCLHLITFCAMIIDLLYSVSKQSQLIEFYISRYWIPVNFMHAISDFLSVYAARFEPFLITILVYLQFNKDKCSFSKI